MAAIAVTTASDALIHTGTSLRDAIVTANADAAGGISDTINFDSSLSGATITLEQGQLELSGAGGGKITIDGSSLSSRLTVSGNSASRVFQIDAGVQSEIDGLAITAGIVSFPVFVGGGVYNQGTLTLNNDMLTNNQGCIGNTGALAISNSTIQGNPGVGLSKAGGINNAAGGQVTATSCVISGNSGSFATSGGIFNEGAMTLTGDTIESNNPGGVYNTGTINIATCTIQGNVAGVGPTGGGITNNGQAVVTNCVIAGNSATLGGGGILNDGTMALGDSTVSGNSTSDPSGGAGIRNDGEMTVWRSTIAQNNATKNGGGVYNALHLTVTDSTIYGNSAVSGAAVYDAGSSRELTVSSSTINGNTASGSVGGIFMGSGGSFIVLNSIVTGNSPGDLDRSPDAGSTNNIIGTAANLGPLGDNGGPTQTMALLAGSPAIDAGTATTSLAASASASATTITVALGSAIARTPGSFLIQIDSEIMLVTNASGNALTVVRGQNSTTPAAHNAGAAVYLATDQRGFPRVGNGVTDIGAYETPASHNSIYVQAVYQDVLGRAADAGGLAYWTFQLDHGRPRGDVAFDLVHSNEYYANIIITPAYVNYLLRSPDAAGLAFWTDLMKNHGLTDERLEANFIASQEFYVVRGGGTNPGWVDALYIAFLGRPADVDGKAFWLQKLAEGESRADIAYGFAASIERERERITQDYLHYLGRAPDEAGINYWLGQFQQGVTNENLITGFVASDEYYAKHST